MLVPELFPFIKLVSGDVKTLAEALQGRNVQEGFRKDAENEEKSVAGIGDDQVRKDGMSMSAGTTDESENGNLHGNRDTMDKVDDPAAIVGMDLAVTVGAADRTGLLFWTE